jgi:hypothetical protein
MGQQASQFEPFLLFLSESDRLVEHLVAEDVESFAHSMVLSPPELIRRGRGPSSIDPFSQDPIGLDYEP